MKTANDYLIDVHGNGISNFDSVPNVRRTHTVSTLSVRFVPDNGNGDAHSVLVLRRCHHRRKGKQTPIKKNAKCIRVFERKRSNRSAVGAAEAWVEGGQS